MLRVLKHTVSFYFLLCFVVFPCHAAPLTVEEYRRKAPSMGEFEVEGYVVKQYRCPPCPVGAMCKPCMRDNILISAKKEIVETYPPNGDYIVAFVSNSQQSFVLGHRYRMLIQVLAGTSTQYGINDVELKSARELVE